MQVVKKENVLIVLSLCENFLLYDDGETAFSGRISDVLEKLPGDMRKIIDKMIREEVKNILKQIGWKDASSKENK